MTRAQILLPDMLYNRSKRYADFKEISVSEVFRHAIELFLSIHVEDRMEDPVQHAWTFPVCRSTGIRQDPFKDEDWREKIYQREVE